MIHLDPFNTFQHYAFRLEGLPEYIVENEKESLAHFKRTGEIIQKDNDWPDFVAKSVAQGRKIQRLRLLSAKPTDYERYEIKAYCGPSAGEEIRTALRDEFSDKYKYDFWFFDDAWIMQMNYAHDGAYLGNEVRSASPQEIEMYKHWQGVFGGAERLLQ